MRKIMMKVILLVLEGEEDYQRELFHLLLLDLLFHLLLLDLLLPLLLNYSGHLWLANSSHLQKLLQMIREMRKDIGLIPVMQAAPTKKRLNLIQLPSQCPDDLEKMCVV
jgi:hypothetical protein